MTAGSNDGEQYSDAELENLGLAYASYDDQVLRLLPTVRAVVAEHGPVVGMAAVAKDLRRNSGWDRDDLILMLATALVRAVRDDPTP